MRRFVGLSSTHSARSPSRAAGRKGAGGGASEAPTTTSKANVEPWPGAGAGTLSTVTPPPISVASRREMARPSPVPPYFRVVDASAWVNAWNSRACCRAVIPTPVSRTANRTRCPSPSAVAEAVTTTSPSSVNLTAFESRLTRTCRTRVTSPSTVSGTESSTKYARSTPLLARAGGEQVDGVLDGAPDVERGGLEVDLAGLDLGEVQDVVDERQERVARGPDRLDEVPLLLAQRRVEEQARHPDDPVHRRPDLVAHRGQKLRLRPGRRERLLACPGGLGVGGLGALLLAAEVGGALGHAPLELGPLAAVPDLLPAPGAGEQPEPGEHGERLERAPLPQRRPDLDPDRVPNLGPGSGPRPRADVEGVVAGREVGVGRPAVGRLGAPALVEPVQAELVADAVGVGEADAGVVERHVIPVVGEPEPGREPVGPDRVGVGPPVALAVRELDAGHPQARARGLAHVGAGVVADGPGDRPEPQPALAVLGEGTRVGLDGREPLGRAVEPVARGPPPVVAREVDAGEPPVRPQPQLVAAVDLGQEEGGAT